MDTRTAARLQCAAHSPLPPLPMRARGQASTSAPSTYAPSDQNFKGTRRGQASRATALQHAGVHAQEQDCGSRPCIHAGILSTSRYQPCQRSRLAVRAAAAGGPDSSVRTCIRDLASPGCLLPLATRSALGYPRQPCSEAHGLICQALIVCFGGSLLPPSL